MAKTILLVEDDQLIVTTLTELLASEDYLVVACRTESEAVDH